MNKFFLKLLLIAAVFILIISILNISVFSKQGVNYQVRQIKMPLYLKLLDFIDRHYNYKNLVVTILADTKDDNAKAIKILDWVNANVRKNPKELPIVDDHPLNIIIRGYGVNDQFEDVFTILCNYGGLDAFFTWIENNAGGEKIPLSFVNIRGRLVIFDSYNGVYFRNNQGMLADIIDIKSGNWIAKNIGGPVKNNLDYSAYFKNIKLMENSVFSRPDMQTPLSRFKYEIKKLLRNA